MRKSEAETVIRWDSEEQIVWIDSCHPSVWRRVEKAGFAPVRVRIHKEREVGRRYKVPLTLFRFRVRQPSDPAKRRVWTANLSKNRRTRQGSPAK